MGIPASMALGAAGGAVAGGALFATIANSRPPELYAVSAVAAGAGAATGLAAGVLAARGSGPVRAALVGTAIAAAVPAGLLAASQLGSDDSGGWRKLGFVVMATLTGAGVAGGGAALLGHALLRR